MNQCAYTKKFTWNIFPKVYTNYFKYALDGSKIVVLYYVDDCVYWLTNEYPGMVC